MEEDIILFEWVFHYMSEKKHIWNWARMEFFNFNDISIQEHKVLTARLCVWSIYFYVCWENCMQNDTFCLDHC